MSVAYIISEYGKVSRDGEHLVFTSKDGKSRPILLFQTQLLVLGSYVSVTGEAFHELFKNRIPVLFMSRSGTFKACIQYDEAKNVFLRQTQYRLLDDPEGSLLIARAIVAGKIQNQLTYMQRITRRKCPGGEAEEAVAQIKRLSHDVAECGEMNALRGLEGMAAKVYFSVLKYNILPDWAEFPCSTKHPPKTNVNAVLSFLYALLSNRIQCALEAHSLDCMAGTLHSTQYGRMSLVYDIMEEFRTCVADTLCCSLFNRGTLAQDDFWQTENADAVYLNENGRRESIHSLRVQVRRHHVLRDSL